MAVYEPGKGTLTLSQWPKVQGSGQEQVAAEAGTQMVLFPQTGQMVTRGKAQTRVAKRLMEEEKGQVKRDKWEVCRQQKGRLRACLFVRGVIENGGIRYSTLSVPCMMMLWPGKVQR